MFQKMLIAIILVCSFAIVQSFYGDCSGYTTEQHCYTKTYCNWWEGYGCYEQITKDGCTGFNDQQTCDRETTCTWDNYYGCYESDLPDRYSQQLATYQTLDPYTVSGMTVNAIVGGTYGAVYNKIVILLHGGGGSGTNWEWQYPYLGDMTGIKYVFPTSDNGGLWYDSIKNGCGLDQDCGYDLDSITTMSDKVVALIDYEMNQNRYRGATGANVYLGGFSQGAQMSSYVQLCKLDYALGGVIVMQGYPLPPLVFMSTSDIAGSKANATYYGEDMRFMVWTGADDIIFPGQQTMDKYEQVLAALEASSTLKVSVIKAGNGHNLIDQEMEQMVSFIGGSDQTVNSISTIFNFSLMLLLSVLILQ